MLGSDEAEVANTRRATFESFRKCIDLEIHSFTVPFSTFRTASFSFKITSCRYCTTSSNEIQFLGHNIKEIKSFSLKLLLSSFEGIGDENSFISQAKNSNKLEVYWSFLLKRQTLKPSRPADVNSAMRTQCNFSILCQFTRKSRGDASVKWPKVRTRCCQQLRGNSDGVTLLGSWQSAPTVFQYNVKEVNMYILSQISNRNLSRKVPADRRFPGVFCFFVLLSTVWLNNA